VPVVVTKLVDGKPVTSTHGTRHFGSPLGDFPFTSTKVYIAATALVINLVVAVALTLVLRLAKAPAGTDETAPDDYRADAASGDVTAAAEQELAAKEDAITTARGGPR
jgi:SSS family solute:Na+ symporter